MCSMYTFLGPAKSRALGIAAAGTISGNSGRAGDAGEGTVAPNARCARHADAASRARRTFSKGLGQRSTRAAAANSPCAPPADAADAHAAVIPGKEKNAVEWATTGQAYVDSPDLAVRYVIASY